VEQQDDQICFGQLRSFLQIDHQERRRLLDFKAIRIAAHPFSQLLPAAARLSHQRQPHAAFSLLSVWAQVKFCYGIPGIGDCSKSCHVAAIRLPEMQAQKSHLTLCVSLGLLIK
jgi:hypothetical protein